MLELENTVLLNYYRFLNEVYGNIPLNMAKSLYTIEEFCEDTMSESVLRGLKSGLVKPRKKSQKNSTAIFLTISLPPKADIKEYLRKAAKFAKKKSFKEPPVYVFEQRSPDSNHKKLGDGLHIHMLVIPLKFEKMLIRNTVNCFGVKPNFVDVVYLFTDVEYDKRIRYMLGFKKPSKLERVKADQKYRKKNDLLDIYNYPLEEVNFLT